MVWKMCVNDQIFLIVILIGIVWQLLFTFIYIIRISHSEIENDHRSSRLTPIASG